MLNLSYKKGRQRLDEETSRFTELSEERAQELLDWAVHIKSSASRRLWLEVVETHSFTGTKEETQNDIAEARAWFRQFE